MSFIDYIEDNLSCRRVSGGGEIQIDDECPFCARYGKIYVNTRSEKGMCHKCGEGFTAIKFVMAHQECSFNDAKKLLKDSSYSLAEPSTVEEIPDLWFPPTIELNVDAIDYLDGRGMLEVGRQFGVRYCIENVVIGDRTHWTARRIIIPVRNKDGQAVSWQGRDITGRSKMKYMFAPGFKKAELLYNLDKVVAGLPIILCEGVMDVWGWIRAGYPNAVATFGKTVSIKQIELLAALKPSLVYIAWDSDASWQKAQFHEDWGHLFDTEFIDLAGKDADELDGERLGTAIKGAKKYNWEDKILSQLYSN